MTLTRTDLDRFTRFAEEQMAKPAGPVTLEECLRLWRVEKGRLESIADIDQASLR